jgi:hypothetical protein
MEADGSSETLVPIHHITRLKVSEDLLIQLLNTSEFLATDTEVPGSIPGATRFSEK